MSAPRMRDVRKAVTNAKIMFKKKGIDVEGDALAVHLTMCPTALQMQAVARGLDARGLYGWLTDGTGGYILRVYRNQGAS